MCAQTPSRRRHRPRKPRGQALAELAVAIPVLFLMLMGGLDATLMIANRMTTASSVRQGARLASELGGLQSNPGATTGQIDAQIVRNVLAVAGGTNFTALREVDIYAPTAPGGVYQLGDPVDQYFISGSSVTPGTITFPIDMRNQTPPNEVSIGVRLLWEYHPPGGIFPKIMQLEDFTVMKATPVID
jgi:TadE-like protein